MLKNEMKESLSKISQARAMLDEMNSIQDEFYSLGSVDRSSQQIFERLFEIQEEVAKMLEEVEEKSGINMH